MRKILYSLLLTAFTLSACNSADKDYLITIKTPHGDMKAILYDETPLHKENFIKLAEEGQFDSTIFHRVIKDFMIQTGNINARPGKEGSIDYTIPAEFVSKYFHHKGALAAARQGDQVNPQKASSGCQFYIVDGIVSSKHELSIDMNMAYRYIQNLYEVPGYENLGLELDSIYRATGNEGILAKIIELKPVIEERFNVDLNKAIAPERLEAYTTVGGSPHLDDEYTVFGRIVEGLDVIDKIAEIPTGPMDRPIDDVYMTVEVERISKKKLEKLYGDKNKF